MNRLTRFTLSTFAAGLALAVAAPATADPTHGENGEPFTIVCDNGHSYEAVGNGNGDFTPAHDLNSNTVLVPTSFGEFHGTVTDEQGTVIEEFTEEAGAKGNSTRNRKTSTSCTFSFHGTFDDPDLGLVTFDGTGSVVGFVTPAR
jgi:hypothetical protein